MVSKGFKCTLVFTWLVGTACAKPQTATAWKISDKVKTASGSVEGHPSALHPEVSEYLGIPYAKPPTGDLRFAAPRKFEAKGTNIIKAVQYGPDCPAPVGSSPAQQISYASVILSVAGIP
jgi:cholinesterase